MPSSRPPNTSCSIGEAMPTTPMPALTFRHSTPHSSQNCGVPNARFTCRWREVTRALVPAAGAVQPSGFQSVGGTR